jgi:CheY-like chemotaxis protein
MTPNKHKVLFIDDSELSLRLVTAALRGAGYDVRSTDDVHDLSSVLGGWRPDVILTDVEMPGMTGVELCRLIKATYETAHVPVVLFSALPHDQLERLARDCEADGFLCKTSGLKRLPDELARLIETVLF